MASSRISSSTSIDAMAPRAPYVTANVNLWPQMDVVFANPARLTALTEQQRGWLQAATQDAAARSADLADRDAQLIAGLCNSGARFVNASRADLAALGKAFAPVLANLGQDPRNKGFIERIQALKQSTSAEAPLTIPAGCSGPAPAQAGAQQGTAAGRQLDGIYRWTLTKKDALEHGTVDDKTAAGLSQFPLVFTMTLREGSWQLEARRPGRRNLRGHQRPHRVRLAERGRCPDLQLLGRRQGRSRRAAGRAHGLGRPIRLVDEDLDQDRLTVPAEVTAPRCRAGSRRRGACPARERFADGAPRRRSRPGRRAREVPTLERGRPHPPRHPRSRP